LAKSHKKSHITIVPIGSVAFNNIFNCKQPKITYEKDIGNDVTHDIIILQATVSGDYAIVEYMTDTEYYFYKEKK